MYRILTFVPFAIILAAGAWKGFADDKPPVSSDALRAALKFYPHKLIYETNRDGNWELYICNADGSDPVNLTKTPDVDEIYPKPSLDGTKICFVADEGKGASRIRNVYYMNSDGSGRTKVADNAPGVLLEPGRHPDRFHQGRV